MSKDEIVESEKSAAIVSGSVLKTDLYDKNFVLNKSDFV